MRWEWIGWLVGSSCIWSSFKISSLPSDVTLPVQKPCMMDAQKLKIGLIASDTSAAGILVTASRGHESILVVRLLVQGRSRWYVYMFAGFAVLLRFISLLRVCFRGTVFRFHHILLDNFIRLTEKAKGAMMSSSGAEIQALIMDIDRMWVTLKISHNRLI